LLRRIAEGGMGAIYEADDPVLERRVAIKVLLPEFARSRERLLRFEREARAASKLKHRNIIDIYDMDRAPDGSVYLVQQLLDGRDLRQLLAERGRLQPDRALSIVIPILEALGVAHERGIVHRDLKPANIFLALEDDGTEVPKLIDFGIAKMLGGSSGSDDPLLTRAGMVIGTFAYMAPEQFRFDVAGDHRIDLWAMGAVLFEMIAGRPPFAPPVDASDMVELSSFGARLNEKDAPRLDDAVEGIPPELATAVADALQRDRARRHPNARAVVEALRRVPTGSVTAPVDEAERVGRLPITQELSGEYPGRTPPQEHPPLVTVDEPAPLPATRVLPAQSDALPHSAVEPPALSAAPAVAARAPVGGGTSQRRWPLVLAAAAPLLVGGVIYWNWRPQSAPLRPPAPPVVIAPPAPPPAPAASPSSLPTAPTPTAPAGDAPHPAAEATPAPAPPALEPAGAPTASGAHPSVTAPKHLAGRQRHHEKSMKPSVTPQHAGPDAPIHAPATPSRAGDPFAAPHD
jgi:serine/threonine-protein kinase